MPSQTAYILLFRGVGGATQLPTALLRKELTAAGFENVATYINSGNAIVTSKLRREKVIAKVAAICREKFDFTKAIFAVTLAEWDRLIENNPFGEVPVPKYLHAAVLADDPTDDAIAKIRSFAKKGEKLEVIERVAYLHTPNGFGTSEMAVQFDKRIGVTNTARNWNSVSKLRELAAGSRVAE